MSPSFNTCSRTFETWIRLAIAQYTTFGFQSDEGFVVYRYLRYKGREPEMSMRTLGEVDAVLDEVRALT